jgi:hypothetical protein
MDLGHLQARQNLPSDFSCGGTCGLRVDGQQQIFAPIFASNIRNAANVPSPSLPTFLLRRTSTKSKRHGRKNNNFRRKFLSKILVYFTTLEYLQGRSANLRNLQRTKEWNHKFATDNQEEWTGNAIVNYELKPEVRHVLRTAAILNGT